MHRVRLLAYREDTEYGVNFGTCEMCMHTGTAENPVYTIEFTDLDTGNKKVREVDGYSWSWGHYDTIYISNVIAFGDWLEVNDITVEDTDMDYFGLSDLVNRWEIGSWHGLT